MLECLMIRIVRRFAVGDGLAGDRSGLRPRPVHILDFSRQPPAAPQGHAFQKCLELAPLVGFDRDRRGRRWIDAAPFEVGDQLGHRAVVRLFLATIR
jgi:hypothetical protein